MYHIALTVVCLHEWVHTVSLSDSRVICVVVVLRGEVEVEAGREPLCNGSVERSLEVITLCAVALIYTILTVITCTQVI